MKARASALLASGFVVLAIVVFVAPPPAGYSPQAMQAAVILLFAAGLWGTGALPEQYTGILALLIAVLAAVAPSHVVFSGFASGTLWLVFSGLFIAEAVRATGLAARFSRVVVDRFASSYLGALVALAFVSSALAFLMPATISRVLLLVPIAQAVAARMGYGPGTRAANGLVLFAIVNTYQFGTTVLPANTPNLVLAGAAETLHGIHLQFATYLLQQLPVLGVLKTLATLALVHRLCAAAPGRPDRHVAHEPMTGAEVRLSVILCAALALWATDFLHGYHAGWIGLAAACACMLPRIGVMPASAFNERIRFAPFFYTGSVLGLGAIMQHTGFAATAGSALLEAFRLDPGADGYNFAALVALAMATGLLTTYPAQPAVLAPLAESFASATGWPVETALMTIAVGFNTMLLPHQVPPIVVGLQVAGISFAETMRVVGAIVALSLLVLVPLHFGWWKLIGMFG